MTFIVGEGCFQESFYDFQSQTRACYPCAHCKNVCIVVFSGCFCGENIAAQRTTNTFYFVCCDRDTDPCTADRDTLFTFACSNCIRNCFAVFGIVYGCIGICTEVLIFDTVLFQIINNCFHQGITAVSATQC